MKETLNYKLKKPEQNDYVKIEDLNENADIIDKKLKDHESQMADNVKKTTQGIDYHVSLAGNDITGDGTISKPFRTIQFAINKIPQCVNHKIRIYIQPGNYDESIQISGLIGSGNLNLLGEGGVNVKNIVCFNIDIPFLIVKVNAVNDSLVGFYFKNLKICRLEECTCTRASKTYAGIESLTSNIYLYKCTSSNRTAGIHSTELSKIVSDGCSGDGNVMGLFATLGGSISKNGTQPVGATAESTWGGGVIR